MKKITERQFMEEYAALRNEFGSVKEKLAQIKKELASLNRRTNRLYKNAERSLYAEPPGSWPKPAFRGLDKCLENLIYWNRAWDSVSEAFKALPGKWGAK